MMKNGDLISWEYTHHLNSKSRTQRMKHGEFIRNVKHIAIYNGNQMAVVQFHGNKRTSKVPLSELQPMSKRRAYLIKAHHDICYNFWKNNNG